jgi:hypothetical protein
MCWSNKKQLIVSLSSAEANYKELCSTICEAIWIRCILEYMGERKGVPTSIKFDNKKPIKLARNPIYHARSKHIETQHHFVRENIQTREIELMYYITNNNVPNIFTKPLGKDKIVIGRDNLGIVENSFLH